MRFESFYQCMNLKAAGIKINLCLVVTNSIFEQIPSLKTRRTDENETTNSVRGLQEKQIFKCIYQ